MTVQPWMNNGVKDVDNPEAFAIADELHKKLREERQG